MHYNVSVLESTSNAVLTLADEGKIVKYNASFLRIFKVPPEAIHDVPIENLYFGENEWIIEQISRV